MEPSQRPVEHTATDLFEVTNGDSPLLATAIHDGHELRPDALERTALDAAARLREEDPHTAAIASVAPSSIVPRRSRFEVDLNRPRHSAVYIDPEDAWGLGLWRERPPDAFIADSLAVYDAFYDHLRDRLDRIVATHGRFVVLDVHSYNHRRGGPGADAEDPEANPEVNVGTGSLDRERWGPIVDRFMGDLAAFRMSARQLDVRENVRFRGGHMSRWIHENYPERGCALAIEFKKTFMDEWSGTVDPTALANLRAALAHTLPGLIEELERM